MSDKTGRSDKGRRSGPEGYVDYHDEGKDGLGKFNAAKTSQQAKGDQGRRSKGDAC